MRYQKRFFVASGHYLRYFRDETCEELLAVVDVIGATVQGRKRAFVLSRDKESFTVRCPSLLVRDDWIETLKTMILRGADKENLLLPDEEGLFIPYHDDESDDDDDDDISSVAAPAAKEKDDDDDDDAEEEEEEEEETVVVVDTKPPPPPASASTTSNCDCLRICGCGTTPQKSS